MSLSNICSPVGLGVEPGQRRCRRRRGARRRPRPGSRAGCWPAISLHRRRGTWSWGDHQALAFDDQPVVLAVVEIALDRRRLPGEGGGFLRRCAGGTGAGPRAPVDGGSRTAGCRDGDRTQRRDHVVPALDRAQVGDVGVEDAAVGEVVVAAELPGAARDLDRRRLVVPGRVELRGGAASIVRLLPAKPTCS